MKNSVKFFVGGIIAATLIFGAFAFTTKQKENKEYLVVRIFEDAKLDYLLLQVCNSEGKVKTEKINLPKTRDGVFENINADHTAETAKIINSYAVKGYTLISNNSLFRQNKDGFQVDYELYSTLIFEK